MLKRSLLAAAGSDRLRAIAETARWARPLADRFVAGTTLDDALRVVADLNARGMSVTLDHLGEAVDDPRHSDAAVASYVAALDAIAAKGLDASVSVKASQFGLPGDPDRAAAALTTIADAAGRAGTHVTVDMEDSSLTDVTLALVRHVRAAGHPHVGCAVQAYLHRTPADVRTLVDEGVSLRLCKGAYDEPSSIAHQDRDAIRLAYVEVAAIMLAAGPAGPRPRMATHDHRLLHAVRALARGQGLDDRAFEVQVLHGVRPHWQEELVRRGLDVRVYVPFGTHWYPYLVRRLAERPANVLFFLRAALGRG